MPDFTLVSVDVDNWDHDMAPWDIPPISAHDTPCTGGADDYLRILTEKIVPAAEAVVRGRAAWRGIAGYSLAGLFALYSLYRTDIFTRAASMSGSLWYPGLTDFIRTHELRASLDKMYFSLGDKESRTRNKYLQTVGENTAAIKEYFANKGIATEFIMNEGNHYENAALRTAAGISWLLKNKETQL